MADVLPADRVRVDTDGWPEVRWARQWWPAPTVGEAHAMALDSVAETPAGVTVEADHPHAWPSPARPDLTPLPVAPMRALINPSRPCAVPADARALLQRFGLTTATLLTSDRQSPKLSRGRPRPAP